MPSVLEKLFDPRSNAVEAACVFVKTLGVSITNTTLARDIEEHPDYPGLLSISDVLTKYKVENLAIRLEAAKLTEAPLPGIASIRGAKSRGNFFSVIRSIGDSGVSFFDPEKHGWTTLPLDQFLPRFAGTLLLAETSEQSGEKNYDKKYRAETRSKILRQFTAFCLPVIVFATALTAFIQNGASALLPVVFSLLTLAGAVTGALLLWYELDQYNPVLQQICSAGKKVNCGAVLQSKASSIMGISWSTIGFTYFVGQLLLLVLTGMTNPSVLAVTSWLNVAALPYVFFSIWYQWKVAKQWCVLCLSVQALLVLQGVTALAGNWYGDIQFQPVLMGMTLTAFVLPFMAVTLLVPALQKAKAGRTHKNELQRLKHNPRIFDALLAREKALTESPDGLGILLGNPSARHKIIKVCNPYCGPCAQAHKPMEELLANNPEVQVQIIFAATGEEGDIRTPPSRHLLAIAASGDEARTKQALDDWYLAEKKDYAAFAERYPMNGELHQQDAHIAAMRDWCDKTGIAFTPTFFVNGHQLPNIYSAGDLQYFLTV